MKIPIEATSEHHHTLVTRLRDHRNVIDPGLDSENAADLLEQYRLALLDIITDTEPDHKVTWRAYRIFKIAAHRGLGMPLPSKFEGKLFDPATGETDADQQPDHV